MAKRGLKGVPADIIQQGFTHHKAGDFASAEKFYRRALKRDKKNADALYLLGSLYFQTDLLTKSEKTLQMALEVQPGRPEAQYNLARVYIQTQRFADAEPLLMEVLKADPHDFSVLGSLGIVQLNLGNYNGAIDFLERAVEVDPTSTEAWCDLGVACSRGDEDKRAAEAFDRALTVDPEHARARHNRAHLRLQNRNFEVGWLDYEARRSDVQAGFIARPFDFPEWSGEDLAEHTILVWGEQGLGDQILHASMFPDLIEKSKLVIIECEPRLQPLFQRSFPNARVVRATLPPIPEILSLSPSRQCAAGSLGQWLRPNENTFPGRPAFLHSHPERTQDILTSCIKSFGAGIRVGLSWKSSRVDLGVHKSVDPATDWAPIFRGRPGVHFISIQYGDTERERVAVETEHGIPIHEISDVNVTKDIDGLAALISTLDLVITTSSTSAHLAGALGIPTWVLVPRGRGRFWYWFNNDRVSPWYPSLTLYWQETAGDWGAPVQAIADEFTSWYEKKSKP